VDYENFAEGLTARTQRGPHIRVGRFWWRWTGAVALLVCVVIFVWRMG
jgi:hypothetical protein